MTVLYLGQAVMQESAFSVLYPSDSMQIIEYGILLVKQLVEHRICFVYSVERLIERVADSLGILAAGCLGAFLLGIEQYAESVAYLLELREYTEQLFLCVVKHGVLLFVAMLCGI